MLVTVQPKNIIFKPPKVSVLKIFISQFKSPLIYILLIAIAITFFLGEFTDAIIISIAVLLNAILGFTQEYKAQNTLFHLKKLLTPIAHVERNGQIIEINAEDVLVGDIVLLSRDFSIPADGIITEYELLEINEAILTGESLPIRKKNGDNVFAGTAILNGIGKMQVTEIGVKTKMGVIGKNVLESEESVTPLQVQIGIIASFISKVVAVVVVFLLFAGVLLQYNFREMLTTSIAVAVAAIPEGLVITITVILTIGMRRILSRKAVVRKLISAETLGAVSIICTDKTGTVTEGKLTVLESNFVNNDLGIYSAILCNNHIDSLEISMRTWVTSSRDSHIQELLGNSIKYHRLDGISFTDKNKFTATLNEFDDKNIIFIFGAPERVLAKCTLTIEQKEQWEGTLEVHARKGRKVVAFCYKYTNKTKLELDMVEDMVWNGLLIYEDPIRPGIEETINICLRAGIAVKMITGDHLSTATYVGEQVGLIPVGTTKKLTLTGDELRALSGDELTVAVRTATVFARIDPLEKLQIVKILQDSNEVVAMTGDGVNDAPALKAADIGIVVNEASDISKSTADIVLLDSNLRTIVHAVSEGRFIFDNIRKVVLFLLSNSFSEILLIITALVFRLPIPLTAAQLLWVNLVEDSFPALALAFEKQAHGVMSKPPRRHDAPIINNRMKSLLVTYIIVSNAMLLLLYYYFSSAIGDLDLMRTLIFLGVGGGSLLSIYSFKSLNRSIFTYNPFSNMYLNVSVIYGFVMLGVAIYTPALNTILGTVPVPSELLAIMIVFVVVNLIAIESIKLLSLKFWPDKEN